MGKSDEMQAEKRAHKAADSESKQKKQLSFDSTLGTTFEDNDGGVYHVRPLPTIV